MNSLRIAFGLLAASASSLIAQTTATTDPVGFITLAVTGTGGTVASQLSFRGLGLTRAVEYQGTAESFTTTTLTDNEATWADNQFNGAAGAYFVEITSVNGSTTAAAVGTTYDITATSDGSNSITTGQSLAGGLTAPIGFKIRKHWTIASVFGAANEAGLQGGPDSSSADQILVFNGTGYDTFYYQQSFLGTGWRNAANPGADASGTRFYPEDGLIIKRQQSSTVNVVLMGAVKTGQTSIPISVGTNIVGNVYGAPMTLGSSGLYTGSTSTGVASGADASSADQILVYNGTGYSTYYYQQSFLGTGWRDAANPGTDASGTQIPVGASFVVKRIGGSGFDWKAPQHPASL